MGEYKRRREAAAERLGPVTAKERAQAEFEAVPPGERLGDHPVQAEYHDDMVAIVRALDEVFNGSARGPDRKTGFVLMVFPFEETGRGGKGRCNYMSNGASRQDITVLMKEMIARFEGQPEPTTGRA